MIRIIDALLLGQFEWGSSNLIHETKQYKNLEHKDLMDTFIKYYKYNMHIALDRSSMSLLEKRDKETIESVLKGGGI
jgi:hypothetical protein